MEGFQIGLKPRAAAGVGAGDRQRNSYIRASEDQPAAHARIREAIVGHVGFLPIETDKRMRIENDARARMCVCLPSPHPTVRFRTEPAAAFQAWDEK